MVCNSMLLNAYSRGRVKPSLVTSSPRKLPSSGALEPSIPIKSLGFSKLLQDLSTILVSLPQGHISDEHYFDIEDTD